MTSVVNLVGVALYDLSGELGGCSVARRQW